MAETNRDPRNLFNEALLNQEEEAGVGGQGGAGNSVVTYNPSLFELTEVRHRIS